MNKRITSLGTLSAFLGVAAMFLLPATLTAASKSEAEVTTAAAKTFVEVWNTKAYGKLNLIVASDFKRVSPGDESNASSLAELKTVMQKLHTAYPDFDLTADRIECYPGGATVEWSSTGTNTGPGDQPPTGRKVKLTGITTVKVKDGKITHEHAVFDRLSWMQQLGYTLQAP